MNIPTIPGFTGSFPTDIYGGTPRYALPPLYQQGMVTPGNLDLNSRPVVRNPDGSVSTVRSFSAGFGGNTMVLPTVIGNRVVGIPEAIAHYRSTGDNLGSFKTVQDAERYSQNLHLQQQQLVAHLTNALLALRAHR